MWPDEVLCVGLCTTLIGKVFSYMLVQELLVVPSPLNKLGVPCSRRFRGLPSRGVAFTLGVKEGGKLTECPFVFGTSRCVGLMHTCRLQTLDPIMDFSLRTHSDLDVFHSKVVEGAANVSSREFLSAIGLPAQKSADVDGCGSPGGGSGEVGSIFLKVGLTLFLIHVATPEL